MSLRSIVAFLLPWTVFTSHLFLATQGFTPYPATNTIAASSKGGLLRLEVPIALVSNESKIFPTGTRTVTKSSPRITTTTTTILGLDESGNGESDNNDGLSTRESDQIVVGVAGSIAALVMMYSEFVLSQTGCGLPAGPFGLVGGVEGISYLSVTGLGGYSIFKKVTTGSGLPAGKFGLLGLAEGLAFLALFAGIIVLGLQITNFGYIPNAVPMEGGMCK